jgi:uncharacterized protein HemY
MHENIRHKYIANIFSVKTFFTKIFLCQFLNFPCNRAKRKYNPPIMNIQELITSIEQAKIANNYPKAREIALGGLHEHTDDYRLYEELADIYLFEGNLEKADEVLMIARELHAESSTGMYLEGYLATAK